MTLADAETTCISRRNAKLKHLKQQNQEITMEIVSSVITTLGNFDVQMFDPQVLDPVFVIPIIIILW